MASRPPAGYQNPNPNIRPQQFYQQQPQMPYRPQQFQQQQQQQYMQQQYPYGAFIPGQYPPMQVLQQPVYPNQFQGPPQMYPQQPPQMAQQQQPLPQAPSTPSVLFPPKPRTVIKISDPNTKEEVSAQELAGTPSKAAAVAPAPFPVVMSSPAPLNPSVVPFSPQTQSHFNNTSGLIPPVSMPSFDSPKRERKPIAIVDPKDSSSPSPTATAAPATAAPAISATTPLKPPAVAAAPSAEEGDVFKNDDKKESSAEQQQEEEEEEEEDSTDLPPVCENAKAVFYPPDMWSPMNESGDKAYPFDFMMEFRELCRNRPKDMRADLTQLQQLGSRSVDQLGFMPPRRQSSRGGPKKDKPVTVIVIPKKAAPMKKSENAWDPNALHNKSEAEKNLMKAKALLNKLTLQTFVTLSDKLINLGTVISNEHMEAFIKQIFQKAIDEQFFSEMYARLCEKMAKAVKNPKESLSEANCVLPAFRKLLLQNCQREFEKDRSTEKDRLDALGRMIKEKRQREEGSKGASEVVAQTREELAKEEEEQYRLQMERGRMFGNIKFIGELFKLGVVPETIIHRDCIIPFMKDATAEEDALECISKLIETAGQILDKSSPKQVDTYFETIKKVIARKEPKLSSRVKFMLMDLCELRESRWEARREKTGPKTIDEIHKDVEKEKAKQLQQQAAPPPPSNPKSGRRLSSGSGSGPQDRRAGAGVPRTGSSDWEPANKKAPPKREEVDMARIGIGKPKTELPSLGGSRRGLGQPNPPRIARNAFEALSEDSQPMPPKPTPPPATKKAVPNLSEEQLKRKIGSLLDEFVANKDIEEVKVTLKELDWTVANERVVIEAATKSLEATEAARKSLSQVVASLVSAKAVSIEELKNGLNQFLGEYEDLCMDIPKGSESFAMFLADLLCAKTLQASFLVSQVISDLPTAFKLVARTISEVAKHSGEAAAKAIVAEFGKPLSELLPESKRAQYSELAKEMHIEFLESVPTDSTAKGLVDLIKAKKSSDEVFDWVKEHVADSATPAFVQALGSAVAIAASDNKSAVNVILQKYTDRDELKVHLLCSLQKHWYELKLDANWLKTWFSALYEDDVVPESAFLKWKSNETVKDTEYPGKGAADAAVQDMLDQLVNAKEED